jgi:hypothetical protein
MNLGGERGAFRSALGGFLEEGRGNTGALVRGSRKTKEPLPEKEGGWGLKPQNRIAVVSGQY